MAENSTDETSEPTSLSQPPQQEEKKEAAGAPAWMATYGDMVTLLLCFFVLLFAMSSTQQETYKELVQSLKSALGSQSVPEAGTRDTLKIRPIPSKKQENDDSKIDELGTMIDKEMDDIASEVRELVMFNKLGGEVSVTKTEDGIVISLSDMLLFEKGGTTLSPKGMEILEKVASVLSTLAYHVKVKGHTDSSPIRSSCYPSNWELSSARASTVVRLLVASGVSPRYISAVGYAHYAPVATNDTPQGRSRNRRVEIVYERDSIAREFADMRKK